MFVIIAGTFASTFLIVGVIACLVLAKRGANPGGPLVGGPVAPVAATDDDANAIRLREKIFHTINWRRKLMGKAPLPPSALQANPLPPGDPA